MFRLTTVWTFAVLALLLLALPAAAGGDSADQTDQAAQAAFVPGVDDLPLMPGLGAVGDEPVVFDTPQGRIVEAYAAGMVDATDVIVFYTETLPQLGWTQTADTAFQREGEELRLDLEPASADQDPKVLTVRFTLTPLR